MSALFPEFSPLLCKQRDSTAPALTVFVCHTSCYDNSTSPHPLRSLMVPQSWVCQWLSDVCMCVCVCSVMKHFPLHFLKCESERMREPSYPVTVSNSEMIRGGSLAFLSLWLLVSPRWNRYAPLAHSWHMIDVIPLPVLFNECVWSQQSMGAHERLPLFWQVALLWINALKTHNDSQGCWCPSNQLGFIIRGKYTQPVLMFLSAGLSSSGCHHPVLMQTQNSSFQGRYGQWSFHCLHDWKTLGSLSVQHQHWIPFAIWKDGSFQSRSLSRGSVPPLTMTKVQECFCFFFQ